MTNICRGKAFKRNAGIIALFVILSVIMTFPLFFKIATHIPGFTYTDEPYAGLWDSWRVKYSILHKVSLSHTPYISYPSGVDMYAGYFTFLWMAIMYILSLISSPVLMFNLQVLINFVLRGIVVYYLVRHVTKNEFSGILSGIVFTFCPFQFVRSWQHLGLTYGQWIPLVILCAIILKERPLRGSFFLFLASLLLLFSFDYSIAYFGVMTLAFFMLYILFFNWRRKISLPRLLFKDVTFFLKVGLAILLVFILLSPQFYLIVKHIGSAGSGATTFNPYYRPFDDLFTQSARLLSYLLPATTHPLFGKFTEQFIGSPLYGISYTEHTLYLGWIPLILAFIAFRKWRRKKKLKAQGPKLIADEAEQFYIGFFVWLALVAFLFSQPPYFTFPYFKIYMPSYFMYKILPMYRAYCRFGLIVAFAISVLAGFGLKFLAERFKSRKTKVIFTSLICGLVLFEFLNFPPFKVIDLTKYPKVYDWLKGQKGDFAVAEYPLDVESPNEYYKYCQTIHRKPIIDATIPGTHANEVARRIWRLSDPPTAPMLRWMGVRYVLVHRSAYESSNDMKMVDEAQKVKQRLLNGLRFMKSVDDVDVYEVTAQPREIVIDD